MPNPRRMARRTARRTSKRTAKRVAAQQQSAAAPAGAAPAAEEEMDPLEEIAEILGFELEDDASDEQIKVMLKDAIDKL
jgi:hypothetical protein